MSGTPILFAAGPSGFELTVPEGVNLIQGTALDTSAPLSESVQRALVATALNVPESGPPLAKLAAIKRRAVILAGDLSRPAPYDIILPVVVETLVNAGIRPSRIAVHACPGKCGPLLGRAAIHRYGEEICATHEVAAWPADGAANPLYAGADLRIAVASRIGSERFEAFLPLAASADFALEISLGEKVAIDIRFGRSYGPLPHKNAERSPTHDSREADVWITCGGGAPWEDTLEEAILSLRPLIKMETHPKVIDLAHKLQRSQEELAKTLVRYGGLNRVEYPASAFSPVSARTAVLVFSGREGLGSAHFTRDLWSLIAQAEEVLASGGNLGKPSQPGPFDPAATLADCLRRYSNTVLFSPGLAGHPEGEDLLERLQEAPHVAARLAICGAQPALWSALEHLHGARYSMYAEPLGWRARK